MPIQNELIRLENENETLSLDIEKLEKYVAGLEKYNSEKEADMLVLADNLQQEGMCDISFTFVQK